MNQIELTDKERAVLWVIACWFNKPVTSKLKHKLYDKKNLSILSKSNHGVVINQRIRDVGVWINQKGNTL